MESLRDDINAVQSDIHAEMYDMRKDIEGMIEGARHYTDEKTRGRKGEPLKYYSAMYDLEYGIEGAAGLDLPYYDRKRHASLKYLKASKFHRWFLDRKLILPFVRYKLPTGVHVEMSPDEYGEIDS